MKNNCKLKWKKLPPNVTFTVEKKYFYLYCTDTGVHWGHSQRQKITEGNLLQGPTWWIFKTFFIFKLNTKIKCVRDFRTKK